MARTYTVSITTITNDGKQMQAVHGPYTATPAHLDEEIACLCHARTNAIPHAQWHIVVIAGSDYGFIVQKFNGDGSFANEMVDKE
jgi:hypothetical protein